MSEFFFRRAEGDHQEDIPVRELQFKGLRMRIPVCLEEMPAQRQETHYPYQEKPDLILFEKEKAVEMTFQFMKDAGQDTDAIAVIGAIRRYVEERFDLQKLYPVRFLKLGDEYISWFLTELFLGEKVVKHRKYVMFSGKDMYHFTLTYPPEEETKWGNIMNWVLFSIEVEHEKN
ncbi:MAG: hypothetical protein HFI91_14455 [Lachnospiraceae bacterium]|jgi:hypothetical protein|nr:hypothetical protein [Lachnospiraceae bacterium]